MLTLMCFFALLTTQEQGTVNALVKMDQPAQHYYQFEMTFPASSETERTLHMPVWTPGSYKVRNYARHLERFQAFDLEDKPLNWSKADKATWVIQAPKDQAFKIRYRLFAFELSVRHNYLDEEQGFINPAAAFIYEKDQKERTIEVRIAPPEGWGVASPLEKVGIFRYRAKNFDELADSPFQFGNFRRHEFLVNDIPHYWIIAGDVSLNETAMIESLKKIGTTVGELFGGDYPFEHYYIFSQFTLSGRGGGLEHANNTMVIGSSYRMRTQKGWNRFLGLMFHEYFHAWNVKAIHDHPLQDFDYQKENYTKLLWLHEGWTSYYDELLLGRAGFVDRSAQLKLTGDSIDGYLQKPGTSQQSLVDASFNTWIHHYLPSPVSYNSRVSYYGDAALSGLALDLLIRHQTNNEKSLDDVMRALYSHSKANDSINMDVVKNILNEIGGSIATDFIKTYIESPTPLPMEMFLEYAGLELDKGKDEKDPPPHAPNPKVDLGIMTSNSGKSVSIRFLKEGSPAWKAGLSIEDEILAINNRRVTSDSYSKVLSWSRPGDQIDILVSRRGKVMTLPLTLEEKPKKLKLKQAKEPSDLEKAIFESLFPLSDKEKEAKAKKEAKEKEAALQKAEAEEASSKDTDTSSQE